MKWGVAVDWPFQPVWHRIPDRPIDVGEVSTEGGIEDVLTRQSIVAVVPPKPVASLRDSERKSGALETLPEIHRSRVRAVLIEIPARPGVQVRVRQRQILPSAVLVRLANPGIKAAGNPRRGR